MDGRIIFKRIPKKWDGPWTGLILLTIGTGGGCCECGNEPPRSMKYREFLPYLMTFWFLKDCVAWIMYTCMYPTEQNVGPSPAQLS